MSSTAIRSSANNRLDAIVEALENAHQEARKYSRVSLNRMPEYFMATKVADFFAKNFRNVGYRLEASVQDTLKDADLPEAQVKEILSNADLRGNGRFDLVLRTGKRNRPVHVLEFKRGSRARGLIQDIRRLAFVCDRVKEDDRLETNYLVVTTKTGKTELEQRLKKEVAWLNNEGHWLNTIDCSLARYKDLGKFTSKHLIDTDDNFAVAVFEIKYQP